MDFVDQLRAGVTLFSFVTFTALVVWAWSRRNRDRFDEAAQLPFAPEAEDIGS
jgi:cytochrome c oxidase cbb3-type subunit 4